MDWAGGPPRVCGHDAIPLPGGLVEGGAVRAVAGVVDQDIEATHLGLDPLEIPGDARRVRDIELHGACGRSERRQRCRERLHLSVEAAAEIDGGALGDAARELNPTDARRRFAAGSFQVDRQLVSAFL
jgi:hypothetical protein